MWQVSFQDGRPQLSVKKFYGHILPYLTFADIPMEPEKTVRWTANLPNVTHETQALETTGISLSFEHKAYLDRAMQSKPNITYSIARLTGSINETFVVTPGATFF